MTQVSSSNPTNTLPGIVTDQPEIFESEPSPSDDTGINDLDLMNESSDEAIALIEVPVQQAFSYFVKRENDIAEFYSQNHGEYKLAAYDHEEETDIEKYHRLVSEVTQLLDKFKAKKTVKPGEYEISAAGNLEGEALINNLEFLSQQLKTLEFAAQDGSLDPIQSNFTSIKAKFDQIKSGIPSNRGGEEIVEDSRDDCAREAAKSIRMGALERRLNLLEKVLGHNENKNQTLLRATGCESLTEAAETLSSWLTLFKNESVNKLSKELNYLTQKLEKIDGLATSSEDDKLDTQTRTKLDQLCNLASSADEYRFMVPNIVSRLNLMEELQDKSAQVTATLVHLERIQAEIKDRLESNKDELRSLNEKFAKNIQQMEEYSVDIDTRISNLREQRD